jgi:hypothetical protein
LQKGQNKKLSKFRLSAQKVTQKKKEKKKQLQKLLGTSLSSRNKIKSRMFLFLFCSFYQRKPKDLIKSFSNIHRLKITKFLKRFRKAALKSLVDYLLYAIR